MTRRLPVISGTLSRRLRRCIVFCAVAVLAPLVVEAQEPSLPADATVVVDTPMYVFRDASRTPMRVLPAGSLVRAIAHQGEWYFVAYTDARFGDEKGYVQAANIQMGADRGALSSRRGSGAFSQRGLIDARAVGFPQTASNDTTRSVFDALFRDEIFLKPTRWFQLAAGVDVRANSNDQVDADWDIDFEDRGVRRPHIALRRLAAAVTTSHFTLDIGKQFIRWGRADVLSPTDRFAPRDYMNVLDSEFLPVIGARASVRAGSETFEAVWLPQMTPSRMPLVDERWTVAPAAASGFRLADGGATFPERRQQGARWTHSGTFDLGLSFFDGSNHLPDLQAAVDLDQQVIEISREYPDLRTYGGEFGLPTPYVSIKGEVALFTSPSSTADEYVLYVAEVERQVGEWLLDIGYAGEVVTKTRGDVLAFGVERGVARTVIGRVAYTVDPRRSVTAEAAVRQNGHGVYTKGEYSQSFGRYLRLTLSGVVIGGKADDFLGQYRRNSHGSAALRFSF